MEQREITTVELFEELAVVLKAFSIGGDIEGLSPKSLPARNIVSHCKNGRSLGEALFLVCQEPASCLDQLLFGSHSLTYDERTEVITARDRNRSLQLILYESLKGPLDRAYECITNSVILTTTFETFTFRQTDASGQALRPFAVFDAGEMCEEIDFTGSIWACVFPSHYAIITRTISFTFPHETVGALFSTTPDSDANLLSDERTAFRQLGCLDGLFTELLSLNAFCDKMQVCSRYPELLSEHKEGAYTLRKYSPQRSSIFDFGEPAGELSRGDFVTTYNIEEEEFHREFLVTPHRWESNDEELYLAAFDILHLLATRRAKLFRIGFASRVYNILFPPVLLTDLSSSSYALFPCLNLYRTPSVGFRRTLSLTFIACPVEVVLNQGERTEIRSRRAYLNELNELKSDLVLSIVDPVASKSVRRYALNGPISALFALPEECAVSEVLRLISQSILKRILGNYLSDFDAERLVSSTLFTSNLESTIATSLLQVEWNPPEGFVQPWERWVATGEDQVFRNSLFRTLFYDDYLDPYFADASRHAVQFEEFSIGNTLGADMAGMTLYNPQSALKVVLYPRVYERYPNHSIVRWMTWQVYIDSALTSLRALLYKFNPILEDRGDLHSIIDALDEMLQEFVDFYDLDIRDYSYRKEYEKLRALMDVDLDYAQLVSKFASSKDDESLREQRLINKLVVSLTIATVTITIVSTIAEMGELDVLNYLVIASVLSTLLVWLGYIMFDPIRRAYKSIYNAADRFRRRR